MSAFEHTLFVPRDEEGFQRRGWQVGVSLVPGFALGGWFHRGHWDLFAGEDHVATARLFLGPMMAAEPNQDKPNGDERSAWWFRRPYAVARRLLGERG